MGVRFLFINLFMLFTNELQRAMDAHSSLMITRVFSASVVGIDATEIEIEVNTGPGEPSIVIL